MIATGLVFLLGVLVASLLALLLAPILWRKAQRFARREFEATIPVSANEIRAEFDRVRAEAAMAIRRQEMDTAEMRVRTSHAQSELGRSDVENAALRKRGKDLEAEMAAFAAERDNIRQTFAAYRDKEKLLNETLDEAQHDGSLNAEELEALAVRFREVSDVSEERKVELVAAETKVERLVETLRMVERASREKDLLIELLRRQAGIAEEEKPRGLLKSGVLPGLFGKTAADKMPDAPTGSSETSSADAVPDADPPVRPPLPSMPRVGLGWESPSPAQSAGRLDAVLSRARPEIGLDAAESVDARDRLADIAAHAIRTAAIAEGAASPLASLLSPPGPSPGSFATGHPPSLADRVRNLGLGKGA